MARKKKIKNETVIGVALIILGLAVVGFTFSDTSFTSVLPLRFLTETFRCDPNAISGNEIQTGNGVECRVSLDVKFDIDDLPQTISFPLSIVDTNSPIILDYDYIPDRPDPACTGSFITDVVSLRITDENGNAIIASTVEGITDLQPLLLPGQRVVVIHYDAGIVPVCPTEPVEYEIDRNISGGDVIFFSAPPEINELSDNLLEQWVHLAQFCCGAFPRTTVDLELSTNFAVAETFQLENPTVITSLRTRIGSDLGGPDQETTVTAFVWNMDTSPPERIITSAETFIGFEGRDETDIDFTFPTTIVLLPTQNNQPINYGVGIKVSQNPGQEFLYGYSPQIGNTHECLKDLTADPDVESNFVTHGICGFDIRHSPLRAFTLLQAAEGTETEDQILDRLSEIEAEILTTDDELTRTELTAILCEGITPQPAICQVGLTANSCGVTEFFFEGDCLCNEGYDRIESGDCKIRDSSLLQIGDFSEEELIIIGIGLLVLVVGGGAIAFARRS